MFYEEGILSKNDCKQENVDHSVTAVGYGSKDNTVYFIVKNSWGDNWGEDGFVRLAAEKNGPGACGVQLEPSQPSA